MIAVHEVSRTHKDSHTGVVLESVPVHGWINGEGSRIHHAGAQAADTEAPEPLRRALQPIHCWLQKRNLFPIEALINRGTLKREDTELICVTLTKTALKWGHYFCRPTGLSQRCVYIRNTLNTTTPTVTITRINNNVPGSCIFQKRGKIHVVYLISLVALL